jgi:uncharacterized repeat protein (TIGR01451 family)
MMLGTSTGRRRCPGVVRALEVLLFGVLCAVMLAWAQRGNAQSGPDLTITKTHSGNFTQSQIGATYTIIVTNSGTSDVLSGNTVTVTDTLPAGLTATSFGGNGWGGCILGAAPACSRGGGNTVLAPGASYPPLTLMVTVDSNAPASVTNTVTVSGGGDINTGNNSASDPTTIDSGPDLTIAKTHIGNFTQSQIGATYTVTVSNSGGAVSANNTVTVTDALPAGLTATSFGGNGWGGCILGAAPACSRGGGNTVLAPGASYPPLTLTVTVDSNAPASVTNTVTVSGGGDINTGNNSASDPTTINSGPPDTTITGNPPALSNSASAVFTFTSTKPGTFECKLDAAIFAACTSPQSYGALGDGAHIFQVRAIDLASNVDPTPAQYAWTVDTTAPLLAITSNPVITAANEGAYAISGTCSEDGRTVNVQIGSLADIATCGVPLSGQYVTAAIDVSALAEGAVALHASLNDAAGNLTSVTGSTTKDTVGPALTISSLAIINSGNAASYSFAGNCESGGSAVGYAVTNGATVSGATACSGGAYAVNGIDATSLSDGTVAFAVTQSDAVGNDAVTNGSVLKDTANPTLTLNLLPAVSIANKSSYVISGTCSEATRDVDVNVTGGGTVGTTTPCGNSGPGAFQTAGLDLSGLADGTLLIAAVLSDAAGNVAHANTSVIKDTIVAAPVINAPAEGSVVNPNPVVSGDGAEAGASLTVNEGGGTVCTATASGTGTWSCASSLGVGVHVIAATQTDSVGNTSAASAPRTFTVQVTSATALASSFNPSILGQSVTFTASVTGDAPTGSVTFEDGASALCTAVPLSGTQAICTTAALAQGSHSLTAAYSGDGANTPSNSPVLTQVVDVTVPDAPAIGIATAGIGQATVTFSPPGNDGGSAITSYTATSSTGGHSGTCSAPCGSITVAGLTNGTPYTFTVTATNGVGTGSPSSPSNSVTPGGAAPVLQGAAARKAHGSAGTFNLPLAP